MSCGGVLRRWTTPKPPSTFHSELFLYDIHTSLQQARKHIFSKTIASSNCFTNWIVMSCVPCVDPCNSVSKDDLDRWTNSLKHVLANQTAMKMFGDYLHTCKLDSEDILELWKMCDDLLRYVHHKKIENESSKIKNDYIAIVECASDVEGLTEHQLRRLEETKNSGSKKILARVEKLRQTAYELMQHDYGLFRKKLLKDHKIVKK